MDKLLINLAKKLLKKILSSNQKNEINKAVRIIKLYLNYLYDANRFRKSSSAIRSADDTERLSAHITMDYHRLEKGMALPSPKPGFGPDVVARLMLNTHKYEKLFGESELTYVSRNVLKIYQEFNQKNQIEMPEIESFLSKTERQMEQYKKNIEGGVSHLSFEELFPVRSEDAKKFLLSRRSVRQFSGQLLADALVSQAIEIAQRAPSVCNRQAARIYVCNDPKRMASILGFQNGNRGFGDKCGAVFIITVDMRAFTSLGERNQAWVDGGIFAMALAQALHALQLGACMLNWSVEASQDKQMRLGLGIDDNQAVITMMGAGYVNKEICIAASPRKKTEDIISWI